MSNNELGDATGETRTRTVEAGADITRGDAVAINSSMTDQRFPIAEPADLNDANLDQLAAIAAANITSGERGTAHFEGPCIAAINGSVNAGERAGLSNSASGGTAGELSAEDGGPVRVLCEEGGTDSAGTNLDAGEAEVYL